MVRAEASENLLKTLKAMKKSLTLLFVAISVLYSKDIAAQGSPDIYKGGLKVDLNDDGSKYFRMISWAQIQARYNDPVLPGSSNLSLNLRRARVLMYSQISKKFLILTHFGLNSLNASNMDPLGKNDNAQLFFHDVWGQYTIGENHAIGGGLHYFNGISRLNNQSTLNMMTLDNNRQSWSTLGLTDQFARHLGIFAKGKWGGFQYRIAINDVVTNNLDTRTPVLNGGAVYGGKRLLGSESAGFAGAGYFEYQFFDQESNFLPFKVGTYVGDKRILNVGAGFFYHPNGSVVAIDTMGTLRGENVALFAADVFYEQPLFDNGSCLSFYGTFQSNNYGTDYLHSAYGTGNMIYSHIGYALPGDKNKIRFQPYASFAYNTYTATPDTRNVYGIGVNTYMSGHHSKLTLEYQRQDFGASTTNAVTLQAMIYL